ncbi:MAG: TerB family tellurite resistance protein [Alphaproteobacteria bacterium]|nr:TerB family tellurite resistance protein [Alphaproteobacteria bacterium]
MSLMQLENILGLFRGKELSEAEKKEVIREALFMTLTRATAADTNIAGLEVATVQRILKDAVGEDVSEKDIRVAANSALYTEGSLEKYLSGVAGKFDASERCAIVDALAKVLKADGRVSPFEVDFFNGVVKALGLSHADVAGLE